MHEGTGEDVAEESGLKTLTRGDVINGRYEIVRPLGDGMLGATFLAKHMASDKHVAIKFIHDQGQSIGQRNAPHVVCYW